MLETALNKKEELESKTDSYDVSVFIPVYNEEDSLNILQGKIDSVFEGKDIKYEVIYVDDGSSDGSYEILKSIATEKDYVKVVKFRRNHGQTAAMSAGIDAASGKVLIPMDSDLQNDPVDIPRLLEKINEGYDVVSGWRKNRQDTFIDRKLPSMIANKIISWISGVELHDYGCSLKAYRAEVLKDVRLYGELHRFIPICASWAGAKVTELAVTHHERQFGQSKYGINRTFKVILDIILLKFLSDFITKPIYFFGGISMASFALSIAAFIWSISLKFVSNVEFDHTPLPILGAMFFTVSIQIFMMGILADLLMRTYYESQDKSTYTVHTVHNL